MPAVSKAQQKFMGMVHAAQKGETPASKEVEKAADNMSDKSAKDFASTKHKGLPDHIDESINPEVFREFMQACSDAGLNSFQIIGLHVLAWLLTLGATGVTVLSALGIAQLAKDAKDAFNNWNDGRKLNPQKVKAIVKDFENKVNKLEGGRKKFFQGIINKMKRANPNDKSSLVSINRDLEHYAKAYDIKEGSVTTKPEEPTSNDLDALPSAVIPGVSEKTKNEGPLGTMRDTKPTPTNDILWKATGRVCEGRGMTERVKMYEKKGGGWRMGKHVDETVYTTLSEFYKNEIKPRKEAKELIVKRRMGEGTGREAKEIAGLTGTRDSIVQKFIDDYNLNSKKLFNYISKGKEKIRKDFATAMSGRPGNRYQGDFVGMFGESIVNEAAPLYKDWDEFVKPDYILVTLKNGRKLKIDKFNYKGSNSVYQAILKAFNDNNHKITNRVVSGMIDRLGESVNETTLNEDDMQEPGGDVVASNGVQDHEVSMAKASLVSIGKAVNDLMGRLGDQEKDIPGWIQDHITNAENYIVQASKGYYDQEDKKLGNNIPKPENQTQYSNGK
jgi:effector-binding domain-containing protein